MKLFKNDRFVDKLLELSPPGLYLNMKNCVLAFKKITKLIKYLQTN